MKKIKAFFNYKPNNDQLSRMALISLAFVLIFSGIGKLVVSPGLDELWFAPFVSESMASVFVAVLPFFEIIVGILLAVRLKLKIMAWVAMLLILGFISNNVWLISEGKALETCGECLGWGIDTWPIGSLYIDLLMLGLLLMGSLFYQRSLREVA